MSDSSGNHSSNYQYSSSQTKGRLSKYQRNRTQTSTATRRPQQPQKPEPRFPAPLKTSAALPLQDGLAPGRLVRAVDGGLDTRGAQCNTEHPDAHDLQEQMPEHKSSAPVVVSAAPTPPVGLPPGLLVRAVDGGLVPRRAEGSTKHHDAHDLQQMPEPRSSAALKSSAALFPQVELPPGFCVRAVDSGLVPRRAEGSTKHHDAHDLQQMPEPRPSAALMSSAALAPQVELPPGFCVRAVDGGLVSRRAEGSTKHHAAHDLQQMPSAELRPSASLMDSAALAPQVDLPPGLLVRAVDDDGLAPRRADGSNTYLDGVNPAAAGKACLTLHTLWDMLQPIVYELLLTHNRTGFLHSVQVTLLVSIFN